MTEQDREQLRNMVPVGEGNALAGLEVWKRLGMWVGRPYSTNLVRWHSC